MLITTFNHFSFPEFDRFEERMKIILMSPFFTGIFKLCRNVISNYLKIRIDITVAIMFLSFALRMSLIVNF